MSEIYHFEWGVDTVGYAFRWRKGDGNSILTSFEYEVVCGCGGPLRFYRPLEEHQGLWRQFGDQCNSREGIIPFVREFGLPYDLPTGSCPVENAINLATFLRALATYHDAGDRLSAVDLFNENAVPRLSAQIVPAKGGRLELKPRPMTLASAMLIQAGEALTGNFQYRACKCCSRWFRLGEGAHTKRREFCKDRCRVAYSRKHAKREGSHERPYS